MTVGPGYDARVATTATLEQGAVAPAWQLTIKQVVII